MVFGELVDTVPMFGSQRKSYILIGALPTAAGLLILAGAAGRWLTFARPDQLGRGWRNAVGDRHGPSGRGRGCDVHGGGPAHRYCGQRAPGRQCSRGTRHGAGAGSARGVGWRPRCRRPLRLARQFHAAPGRFPRMADHPSDFGRRRVPRAVPKPWNGGRSTGGFSAAASFSALLWWCSAPAAFRSGRRSSSSSRWRWSATACAGDGRARPQHEDGHSVRHDHRFRL